MGVSVLSVYACVSAYVLMSVYTCYMHLYLVITADVYFVAPDYCVHTCMCECVWVDVHGCMCLREYERVST